MHIKLGFPEPSITLRYSLAAQRVIGEMVYFR